MPKIKLGLYKHFKGKIYEVIGEAKHSETLENLVVYQTKYGKKQIWARPVKIFLEKINVGTRHCPVPRFKFIK